ncbi:CD2 antigen cytoplasmic tail-binding protein 2 homolog isoform X1 [Copidosoma floridanum]|uniref:CD2 antigen cytoplasmic tail-binding protein 2 homolog isoform X1 n=1 Tax=Copidosoma floridanum TaxID=29053 RepID=UPI0006C9842F|nr:CD2 antigen cytoplasmic tail-binding protein 2 homolog isoform X1 [Copidosoma floridanum]XP_023245392.1 CD2 antigen cytoplasmic tail-binding protein 2 homolog isoform X1 [Copidosoma floridanum]
MTKRKLEEYIEVKATFKHSLDSDEEDDEAKEESYDVLNENDIEGVEDGPSAAETNTGFTAFNMKEELEEGHFDKEGHYHWKKEKEIRDNWLDNIDWVKVKSQEGGKDSKDKESDESDGEDGFMFDPTNLYKQILEYLKPGESVSKALVRLGKGTKRLTTAEKWKRKKDPNAVTEDSETSAAITKLTELANELLTQTGNMDIYQETYEQIQKKISLADKHSVKVEAELDMFADDFDSKEKDKKSDCKQEGESTSQNTESESCKDELSDNEVVWELKWSQDESAKVHGPHTSQQMHSWAKEGYFKNGAWVRKKGQSGEFYNATRIDFELYL